MDTDTVDRQESKAPQDPSFELRYFKDVLGP